MGLDTTEFKLVDVPEEKEWFTTEMFHDVTQHGWSASDWEEGFPTIPPECEVYHRVFENDKGYFLVVTSEPFGVNTDFTPTSVSITLHDVQDLSQCF